MPTEDKRRGKNLPSPVTPPTTTCFRIRIPNAVEYKAALFGVLGQLAEWYTWDHPLNGADCPDCEEAAQLWAKALAEATFEEECDETMSCADVADCIENNPTTRNIIQQIISSQSTPGELATPGQAMTTVQATTPLNPAPPDCDPDVLWAQCEQLTNYMVDAARDTLEYIETYSNALEGAQFIELAPFLGTIIDEAQIDKAIDFINWIQENVKEYFEAADTTLNRQAIACSIFCACRADCEITIDRIWGTINERLGGILNPGDIDSLDDFIDAALTLIGSETIALDAALVVITGFAKFAGYLGVKGIDKTLNLVLKVAMNDANDDWMLLCEECAEPPSEYTPVIGSNIDTPGGTLSGPDSEGYYTATATFVAVDYRIGIKEATNKVFRLANITYPDGPSACQVFDRADDSFYVGCGYINQYANEGNPAIKSIVWTFTGVQTVRFQMIAP